MKTANMYDNNFQPLIKKYSDKMVVFVDGNFKKVENNAKNIKFFKRGNNNEIMIVESVFSMIQNLCNSKRMYHRKWDYLESKVAYRLASFNILAL